jgi:hypothetical protein
MTTACGSVMVEIMIKANNGMDTGMKSIQESQNVTIVKNTLNRE